MRRVLGVLNLILGGLLVLLIFLFDDKLIISTGAIFFVFVNFFLYVLSQKQIGKYAFKETKEGEYSKEIQKKIEDGFEGILHRYQEKEFAFIQEKLRNYTTHSLLESIDILFFLLSEALERIKEVTSQQNHGELKNNLSFIKEFFCPFCSTRDIVVEFQNFVKEKSKENLASFHALFNEIKEKESITFANMVGLVKDFTETLEKGKMSKEKNTENIALVFSKTHQLQENIAYAINSYFEQFQKIEGIFHEMEDIFQQIRLITLNLSVEANKSQNKVFHVIAQELHNLSYRTQNFVKNVLQGMKASIETKAQEREERLRDIEEIDKQINKAKEINEEFDVIMKGLYDLVGNLNEIVSVFIEDKKSIHSALKEIQNIEISYEIIDHIFTLVKTHVLKYSDDIHTSIGGRKGACDDEPYQKSLIKKTLDEVKELITTEEERQFLKSLYKKYLNLDVYLSEINIPEERIILFDQDENV